MIMTYMGIRQQASNLNLKRKPVGDVVLRGAYSYHKNEIIYAEEEFEVWKDLKTTSHSFFSKLTSRVATGELLSIYVDYQVNKEFIPQKVFIEKVMGTEVVTETYKFNDKSNLITYVHQSKTGNIEEKFTTTPKFTIASPCTATSCIYLKSKKEDTAGRNNYTLIQSFNNWSFEEKPKFKNIILSRVGLTAKAINIQGKNLQAVEYKIIEEFENPDLTLKNQKNSISAFVSRYITVPYMVKSTDGIKVQIKYLNDLESD